MNKSNKLFEFDVLRAVCIIFLMFVHSDIFSTYLFGIKLEPIGPYVGTFMLGSFFFMAGYFIEYSHRNRQQSFPSYIWSKFIRLFPPYWLALFLFMTVLGFSLKRFDFLIYASNLQFVFSPTFVKPLLTLWYLSVVFAYYVVFGLFLQCRGRDLLAWAVFVFLVSYYLSYKYELFDDRFFEYYFVFFIGILIAKYDSLRERIFLAPLMVQIFVGLIGAILFGIFEFGNYRTRSFGYLFASNLYILSWAVLALKLFREKWLQWPVWRPISYASFFAYLLHRPIWEIMFMFIKFPPTIYAGWYRLLPGSIFVFVISYCMQFSYDTFLKAASSLWKLLTFRKDSTVS